MTEEGLPQVSSKLDHSFPYSYPSVSYPSVSYPSVFTTYPLDWVILPSQSMYFQDWSLRRRDSPPPPRYISRFLMSFIVLLTIVEMTAFFKRKEELFGPKFYQICLNCPTCALSEATKTFSERFFFLY